MNLVPLIQETALRIMLVMAISTPAILFGWFACQRLRLSASAKVKIIRLIVAKSLIFDVLIVGVLGMFTSCLAFPRFWIVAFPDFLPALVVNGYLVGGIGMLSALFLSLAYAERIRARAHDAPSQGRQQTMKLLSKFGGHRVTVRESSEVHCLSLAGLFHPTLIVPAANPNVKQTEILHEIAHVINRDLAWTLVAKVFQVVLFPLPWAHWLVTEAILWHEIRADEAAARNSTASRLELAESILGAISLAHSPLLSMSGQGKHVARRLNSLYKPVTGNRAPVWLAGLVVLSAVPLPTMQVQVFIAQRREPVLMRTKTNEVFTGQGVAASRLSMQIASREPG